MTQPVGSSAPAQASSPAPAGPALAGTPSPQGTGLPDRVAAVVGAVPGVAGLGGGTFGDIATYLPGRRVSGVADRGDHLAVSVTADVAMAGNLPALADRVRAAVASLDPRPVDVDIADIADPADRPS